MVAQILHRLLGGQRHRVSTGSRPRLRAGLAASGAASPGKTRCGGRVPARLVLVSFPPWCQQVQPHTLPQHGPVLPSPRAASCGRSASSRGRAGAVLLGAGGCCVPARYRGCYRAGGQLQSPALAPEHPTAIGAPHKLPACLGRGCKPQMPFPISNASHPSQPAGPVTPSSPAHVGSAAATCSSTGQ